MNFPSARRSASWSAGVSDVPPMSRHNQHTRSVEEDRSLLGGTHAMKCVKPSADILEGLSTGVQVHLSAPHLIYKWL